MKLLAVFTFSIIAYVASAQTYALKADYLIDGISDTEYANPTVVVYKDRIIEVNFEDHVPDSAHLVDLKGYTILPGLMDMHTHLLLNGLNQFEKDLYNRSASFRSLRAVSHLRASLSNGFTTIRDVSTCGAGFADVDLAVAVNWGLIEGPRVYPVTRGIAVTGSLIPLYRDQNWELSLPSIAQYVTGKDECLKAVREQISRGATWIKVFADSHMQDHTTFTLEELTTIVKEADKNGLKVAAHANSPDGIELAINAGVNSIEHGAGFSEKLIQKAIDNDVFLCPTISAYTWLRSQSLDRRYDMLRNAYNQGMKIVLATDVGAFPWTINQVGELEYWVDKAGFKPLDAIKSATSIPADLLGRSNDLGQIKKGYIADIIAVKGNPAEDITYLQEVVFVMKEGTIYKNK